MSHEDEHALVRRRIREKVISTYDKPPRGIDRVSYADCKPCACDDSCVRRGGVALVYNKGEIIWWFGYCRNCNLAWYGTPIAREEDERIPAVCCGLLGDELGSAMAHAILSHGENK